MPQKFFAVVKDAYLQWNPLLHILLFIFPLFLCLGILSLFSEESPSNLPVGGIAEGGGPLQDRLLRAIEATPTVKISKR